MGSDLIFFILVNDDLVVLFHIYVIFSYGVTFGHMTNYLFFDSYQGIRPLNGHNPKRNLYRQPFLFEKCSKNT